MTGLFTGFNVLGAWFLYALLTFFFGKRKKSQNVWFILGIVGFILLCSLIVEYGIAWYSGYLEEQLTRSYKTNSLLVVFMVFEFTVGIIASLNLFKKIRAKRRLRYAQLVLLSIYLLASLSLYGFSFFEYATSIIPGWHTTVYAIGNFWGLIIWLVVIAVLSLINGVKVE